MNSKLLPTISIIVLILLLTSSVSAGFFGESDSNTKNDDKTFIIGFDPQFPPFGFQDSNGEYTGFDVELAKEVARRNNWTFVAEPLIDWETKDNELDSGMIDCIWSEFTIDTREDKYTWSKPYFNNKQVFVVKDDSNISSIKDLKGKSIELQKSTSITNALETDNKTLADSFARMTDVDNYNTAYMDLKSGACDALIVDIGSANYHLKNNENNKTFKILDEELVSEKYGIAFKKGNDALRNQVQDTLDEMYADGTVDKIAQKYSAYGIPEGVIKP